jgi:hypothetical protein
MSAPGRTAVVAAVQLTKGVDAILDSRAAEPAIAVDGGGYGKPVTARARPIAP